MTYARPSGQPAAAPHSADKPAWRLNAIKLHGVFPMQLDISRPQSPSQKG